VIAVRDHLERFGDAEIVIVTFAAPERLAAQRAHLDVPFTIVADTERSLYRALGAERASTRQVWSIGTMRMYVRLLRSGRRLQRATEDIRQLGADAVIGRDGRLRYVSLPPSPDARPPVTELIAALD
jgi:peroxiredoxin